MKTRVSFFVDIGEEAGATVTWSRLLPPIHVWKTDSDSSAYSPPPDGKMFTDITSSASDEIAKAIAEKALEEFHAARDRYYREEDGPYVFPGAWSEATYEALATTLESKWRLGWTEGVITLYGDPGDVHESVVELLSTEVKAVALDCTHPVVPPTFHTL
jgi:hypothetical protein